MPLRKVSLRCILYNKKTLQHPRVIVRDAGFEPKTAVLAVFHATSK